VNCKSADKKKKRWGEKANKNLKSKKRKQRLWENWNPQGMKRENGNRVVVISGGGTATAVG